MGEMGLRANATPFVGMSNETFDAVMLKPSDNKIRRRDASALQRFSFSCCYRLLAQCEVASALLIDD